MPVNQYSTPQLLCDDVLHWAATYDGPPFHALLCDPPYELNFMGARWDASGIAFRPETWVALARHLLPGAFIMAFASSRGWHRLACAMEDAGLILHPSIFGWVFGSGFPKATRVDSQIDAAAGAEREEVECYDRRSRYDGVERSSNGATGESQCRGGRQESMVRVTAPATPLAQAWAGHRYGLQALKPALEPVIVAQVPYHGRPVDSITATGAGALNIEGGRIGQGEDRCSGGSQGSTPVESMTWRTLLGEEQPPSKRWPSNFALCHLPSCKPLGTRQVEGTHCSNNRSGIHFGGHQPSRHTPDYASSDGTETVQAYACADGCPVAALDAQAGDLGNAYRPHRVVGSETEASLFGRRQLGNTYEDSSGSASRFFHVSDWSLDVAEQLAQANPVYYCGKASARERSAGLEGMPLQEGMMQLRSNLTQEQREYVMRELKAAGIVP